MEQNLEDIINQTLQEHCTKNSSLTRLSTGNHMTVGIVRDIYISPFTLHISTFSNHFKFAYAIYCTLHFFVSCKIDVVYDQTKDFLLQKSQPQKGLLDTNLSDAYFSSNLNYIHLPSITVKF